MTQSNLNLTLVNILVNRQIRKKVVFKFDICSSNKEKYFGLGIKIIFQYLTMIGLAD